jgi:hypothetical protein
VTKGEEIRQRVEEMCKDVDARIQPARRKADEAERAGDASEASFWSRYAALWATIVHRGTDALGRCPVCEEPVPCQDLEYEHGLAVAWLPDVEHIAHGRSPG